MHQTMAVNSHCLEHIMTLSERRDIVAGEDIVDDKGNKLWARGQKVSRNLQERLLQHRLLRPLETVLTVGDGIKADQIAAACLEMIDRNELLQRLCGSTDARSLLRAFGDTRLPGPLKLLLTSACDTGLSIYGHSLYCMAVSAGIAARLRLGDHSAQQLVLAALVHDIGELYINPDYIHSKVRLAPSEWKQVAAHPRIGQILIQELTQLPATIPAAVAEHHERMDGSGYPAQHAGLALSSLGRLLAVADTTSAILAGDLADKPHRISLALRIVPEEFDHAATNAVLSVMRGNISADSACHETAHLQRIHGIVARLRNARQLSESLLSAENRVVADTARYVQDALLVLTKALSATGAVEATLIEEVAVDRSAIAEILLVARETEWRLSNLARNVFLRAHLIHDGADLPLVLPLIDALDATS